MARNLSLLKQQICDRIPIDCARESIGGLASSEFAAVALVMPSCSANELAKTVLMTCPTDPLG